MKTRRKHVMVRLTEEELARLAAHKPATEKLAVFTRTLLLDAVTRPAADPPVTCLDLRRAVTFLVACLSPDITLEQADELFGRWAGRPVAGEGRDADRE